MKRLGLGGTALLPAGKLSGRVKSKPPATTDWDIPLGLPFLLNTHRSNRKKVELEHLSEKIRREEVANAAGNGAAAAG